MTVKVECQACGVELKVKLEDVITSLIDCVERDSIYCGYLCTTCGESEEEEISDEEND